MLLRRGVLEAIVEGRVDLAFRRWRRPTVKSGGRLRTSAGELAIDAVEVVSAESIGDEDARRAGEESRDSLLESLGPASRGSLYRVRLRFGGPDPRVTLRDRARFTPAEREQLRARLASLDARRAWTSETLRLIRSYPGRRASELAARAGRDVGRFKADVRRLKELGLTESLEVGYRLSPRGQAWLRMPRTANGSRAPKSARRAGPKSDRGR